MKSFLDEDKEVRYFPNDSEMPILIHYLQVYFSHPERSIQRSQVVQSVVSILSTKNKHWNHRTVRLWFNNNKRVFFRPTSPISQSQSSSKEISRQDPAIQASANKPPFFIPARSLSVVQLPSISRPLPPPPPAIQAHAKVSSSSPAAPSSLPSKPFAPPRMVQAKPGSFALQLMAETEGILANKQSISQCLTAEKNITDKIASLHEQRWSQLIAIQPCRTSILDCASIPSTSCQQSGTTAPALQGTVSYDLIDCGIVTPNKGPAVLSWDSEFQHQRLHFSGSVCDTSNASALAYSANDDTIWVQSGTKLKSYSGSGLVEKNCITTNGKYSNRSVMTFWNDSLALANGSSIMSWSPKLLEANAESKQVEADQNDPNAESNVGLCLTLSMPSITSLATVSDSLVVASTEHHSAQVYAPNGAIVARAIGHTSGITCLHSFDATSFITGSADQTAKYWDIRTHLPVLNLLRHRGIVTCVYGDGNINSNIVITGGTDGVVRGWDIRQLRNLFSFSVGNGSPAAIGLSMDSKTLTIVTSEKVTDNFFDLGKYGPKLDPLMKQLDIPMNSVLAYSLS